MIRSQTRKQNSFQPRLKADSPKPRVGATTARGVLKCLSSIQSLKFKIKLCILSKKLEWNIHHIQFALLTFFFQWSLRGIKSITCCIASPPSFSRTFHFPKLKLCPHKTLPELLTPPSTFCLCGCDSSRDLLGVGSEGTCLLRCLSW